MSKLLEIKMSRCTLFLKESELQMLLAKSPEVWTEALKRGKRILRHRKMVKRGEDKVRDG